MGPSKICLSIAPLEIPKSNRIKSWENCLIVDTSICIEYESPCRYVNVEFVNTQYKSSLYNTTFVWAD